MPDSAAKIEIRFAGEGEWGCGGRAGRMTEAEGWRIVAGKASRTERKHLHLMSPSTP